MKTHHGFPSPVAEVRRALLTHPIKNATPPIGVTIGGQYVLHEVIGRGGMGTVYRAEQLGRSRTVAVKLLDPGTIDGAGARRFRDEATTAGRLHHPNTVEVIDAGVTDGGTPYLVMEYVRGRSLRRLLTEDDVPSQRRGIDIVLQVLAALEGAHRAGVIHADVKSDNVMVDQVGGTDAVKLVDFGLARLVKVHTDDGEDRGFAGTPEFMAPELICGELPTAASDLYAAGVILYEILTGTPPFVGGSSAEILTMHMVDMVVPPSLRRPERTFSPALERVVARALGKTPRTRFATAAGFAAALAEAGTVLVEDPPRRRDVPVPVADVPTRPLAQAASVTLDDEVQPDHVEIRAAIAVGNLEAAAERYLVISNALAERDRLSEAIQVLEEAVCALRGCATTTTRNGMLLWPLEATLARRLDDAGDRLRARRIAAEAERHAVAGGSKFGRDSTRLLLLHLAVRRTRERRKRSAW